MQLSLICCWALTSLYHFHTAAALGKSAPFHRFAFCCSPTWLHWSSHGFTLHPLNGLGSFGSPLNLKLPHSAADNLPSVCCTAYGRNRKSNSIEVKHRIVSSLCETTQDWDLDCLQTKWSTVMYDDDWWNGGGSLMLLTHRLHHTSTSTTGTSTGTKHQQTDLGIPLISPHYHYRPILWSSVKE